MPTSSLLVRYLSTSGILWLNVRSPSSAVVWALTQVAPMRAYTTAAAPRPAQTSAGTAGLDVVAGLRAVPDPPSLGPCPGRGDCRVRPHLRSTPAYRESVVVDRGLADQAMPGANQ